MHAILLSLLLAAATPRPSIAATRAELWRAFKTDDRADIPPAARPLLVRYKHQLRDFAAAAVAAEGTPEDAQTRAAKLFASLGVEREEEGEGMSFSYPVPGDTSLIAATTTIEIPCGRDSSLYLFRREASGWRLILAWESNGYAKVSEALGIFGFRVSPPDAHGGFFVLTASVTPWCSSNWQALRFEVLRPGDGAQPRVLLRTEHSMYLPARYELSVSADGFRVEWAAEMTLDQGRHTRSYIEHYTVNGDRVQRVPPLAESAMDFVDVWKAMPWTEAEHYGGTRDVHRLLNRDRRLSEFGDEQEGSGGVWTVPLDFTRESGGREMITFTVEQKGDEYRIAGVDRKPMPEEAWSLSMRREELWKALGSDLRTDVPPAARPLLTLYKHQLREFAAVVIAEEGNPVHAQRRAAELFEEAGIKDDHIWFSYPTVGTDLIAATVTIAIPCGSDSSLYLFRRQENGWRLILARESNGYNDVAGALGVFRFGVSPPDAAGNFFVVTANVNPWCSSNWQSLRFDVLRPASDLYHPRVLFRARRTIYDPYEHGYELRITPDGFRLDFQGSQSLDTGILVRDHIERYAVEGDRVRRLPPLAADATGFVDEWKSMPWSEASRYGGTHEIHRLLNRDDLSSSFDPPEKNEDGMWTVPLWIEKLGEWILFTVRQEGESFRVRRISREAVAPASKR